MRPVLLQAVTSARPWLGEGESTTPGGGGNDTLAGGAGGGGAGGATGSITLTQAELDKKVQAEVTRVNTNEKRIWQDRNKKLVDDLEGIKKQANVTAEQKEQLQQQIDDLKQTYMTEKDQKEQEIGKLQKKYDSDIAAKDKESATWKGRFETKSFSVDVRDAAHEFEAFDASQIEAILVPFKAFEEGLDDNQRPNGDFNAIIKDFPALDKEGKSVKLKLSVRDAVKKMTEMPDKYGNLFKAKGQSGTGTSTSQTGGSGSGNGKLGDIENMSPQEYAKNRPGIRDKMREAQT